MYIYNVRFESKYKNYDSFRRLRYHLKAAHNLDSKTVTDDVLLKHYSPFHELSFWNRMKNPKDQNENGNGN